MWCFDMVAAPPVRTSTFACSCARMHELASGLIARGVQLVGGSAGGGAGAMGGLGGGGGGGHPRARSGFDEHMRGDCFCGGQVIELSGGW